MTTHKLPCQANDCLEMVVVDSNDEFVPKYCKDHYLEYKKSITTNNADKSTYEFPMGANLFESLFERNWFWDKPDQSIDPK